MLQQVDFVQLNCLTSEDLAVTQVALKKLRGVTGVTPDNVRDYWTALLLYWTTRVSRSSARVTRGNARITQYNARCNLCSVIVVFAKSDVEFVLSQPLRKRKNCKK